MEDVDCLVVGAGVVGIAAARALAAEGREVIIVDAADGIGTGTSSRNSEVIHAGIYYPKASLMAQLCVRGRRLLYAFCAERGVPHKQCGKLIVAADEAERTRLLEIKARGESNGVEGLRLLDAGEACALEPNLACAGALLSPHTGIIDSHGYMLAMQAEAEALGSVFVFNCPVESGRACDDGGIVVETGGSDPMLLRCRSLINAAGLSAPLLAGRIKGMPAGSIPRPYYAKGSYFTLTGPAPFSRLIYPVPVPGGLGVHLTLDLGGQARFGPDVEWIDTLDYAVNPRRAARFYEAVRRYWPALKDGALLPGYAGIRPKIAPPDGPPQDFMVQDRHSHGIRGLVNLFGIESPGLTAAMALGELIRDAARH